MSDALHPWDQQPGEPPEAYRRFLTYRNLGPERTLVKAIESKKGKKKESPVGRWADDSAGYAWVSRACAWDIANLKARGAELAVIWAETVMVAARRALEALREEDCKPASFGDVLKAIETLSKYITPDALTGLQPVQSVQREPKQLAGESVSTDG